MIHNAKMDKKMSETIATDQTHFDWSDLIDSLNRMLRLRTTPIGMKLFTTIAEMEAIPRIRRPSAIHMTDQIVGQASRNGWFFGGLDPPLSHWLWMKSSGTSHITSCILPR